MQYLVTLESFGGLWLTCSRTLLFTKVKLMLLHSVLIANTFFIPSPTVNIKHVLMMCKHYKPFPQKTGTFLNIPPLHLHQSHAHTDVHG